MCKMAHVNMANTSHRLKLKNQKIDLEMCQVNKKNKAHSIHLLTHMNKCHYSLEI